MNLYFVLKLRFGGICLYKLKNKSKVSECKSMLLRLLLQKNVSNEKNIVIQKNNKSSSALYLWNIDPELGHRENSILFCLWLRNGNTAKYLGEKLIGEDIGASERQ